MKIRINSNEVYEIRFDEEVSPRQFQELLFRLNSINKLIGRDPLSSLSGTKTLNNGETQGRRKYQKMSWVKDRNLCIKVLKLHYHGTNEQKQEFAKRNRRPWIEIMKNLYSIRNRNKITPEEVGLKSYKIKGGNFDVSEYRQREVSEDEFNIDDIMGDDVIPQQTIKPSFGGFRPWAKNRDVAVNLIKLHYLGRKPDKLKYAENIGIPWDDIVKAVHNIVIKWKITPDEIGIPFFPQKGNPSKTIFELKRILAERRMKYIPKKDRENTEENKYESGIIHYNINGRYGCNESVNPTASKLSKDWNKVTCDNCKRKFG